ncbi:MAG: ABC transporter ATP-binding protein [Acidaminococcaceae bacterium]|jgi:iron(III) transport system ATP-binding protein|nr:ABC transporter ATP-binding protein [Acidaminococcaceae bacterium]MCI2110556.1 ABC transporter ATP-binding protein [Acidaminococcaceae bacterium]
MTKAKKVTIKNLSKIYPGQNGKQVIAVNHVSLDINPGELVTLLGPSGCGKTTILRMVAGFEIPTHGDIYIGEDRVNSLTPDKRDTAMVFQSYALFPHLNIYDNIAYGLKIKKFSKEEIKNKVNAILELVGLTGMENRAPNQLSGGQQQRVALARALVMEPGVLLFDEPLSNLDAKLRVYMRNEIHKIQRKVGITSIYVTHDQSEAMSLSDRVIIMHAGNIEQIGTPHEIYMKPASEFVADFIGIANIVPATVVESKQGAITVKIFGKDFSTDYDKELAVGQNCKAVLRPEAVQIGVTGEVEAKVTSSIFMGESQDYVVDVGGTKLQVKEYNPGSKQVFAAGETAFLTLDKRALHVLQSAKA